MVSHVSKRKSNKENCGFNDEVAAGEFDNEIIAWGEAL